MIALCFVLAAVDLFIGTQGLGNVTPAAAYPFGLVQAGPDTSASRDEFKYDKGHCSGYQHDDRWIWRFSQLHLSGTGCSSFGDFGIMPFDGEWDCERNAIPLDKSLEVAEPGYYAVGVSNGLGVTRCEMTALEHTVVYRFTFGRKAREAKLLVDLDWGLCPAGPTNCWGRFIDKCHFGAMGETVYGGHRAWNWNGYEYHFALKASAKIDSIETIREPKGARGGIYALHFGDIREGELRIRLALSNRSAEAAEGNLLAEAPTDDFNAARAKSAEAWRRRLGVVRLGAGCDPKVRTSFETSLYRMFVQPNRQSDVGEKPLYSTFSLWDTFRAAHPFYTIVAPEENAAFVRSMLDQYDRQGYLPIWALGGGENHCMIGHHAVPVVVDAFLKGMLGKDEAERAYRAVKDSLTVCHKAASDATWGLLKEDWDILDRYGYYPFDKMRGEYNGMEVRGESVARTYECAYDDACAARFAAALGKKADADFFRKRSAAWRNVFDASIGYARGKDSCGRWREPFNRYDCGSGPWADNDFCEGGSCQYTWHVMHDIAGLVEALGGRKNARERLDLLFADKVPGKEDRGFNYDISGCIGQYVHGNEPSHHIAYCYVYTDCPWKTGLVVRRIFDTQYGISPDGLCGNDDCGQMSAWYVFSALGFYPLDPCGGVYVIGAPQVPEARIRLGEWGTGNGEREFRIVAHNLSRENKYVKSVSLNGKPLVGRVIPNAPILRHSDIMAGGVLEFRMCSLGSHD